MGLSHEALHLWHIISHTCPAALLPIVLLRLAAQESLAMGANFDLGRRRDNMLAYLAPAAPEVQDDPLYWQLAPVLRHMLRYQAAPNPEMLAEFEEIHESILALWLPETSTNTSAGASPAGSLTPPPRINNRTHAASLRLAILTDREVDCLVLEELMTLGGGLDVLLFVASGEGSPLLVCNFWDESATAGFDSVALPNNVTKARELLTAARPDVAIFTTHASPILHYLSMNRISPVQVRLSTPQTEVVELPP